MIEDKSIQVPGVIGGSAAAERPDIAGIAGMLIGAAAMVCLLLGILIPLFPWILAGMLGIALLVLGALARPPLRIWVLLIGFLSLVPPTVFLLVQLLPRAI